MPTARDIRLRPLDARTARSFIERHHYSRKSTPHTQFHIGVYLGASLEGVMQYGPSIDRRKMLGLVEGTSLRQCVELNRMAFTDRLPRNSESRALAISLRLLRRHAPHLKWVVTFADATQCGDGTIYRAAGFLLTAVKPNGNLVRLPSGEVVHKMLLACTPNAPRPELGGRSFFDVTGGSFSMTRYVEESGGEIIPGYQIRYIAFLDRTWRDRLTCEVLPYSVLDQMGARMYRGERPRPCDGSADSGAPGIPPGGGGASPTPSLQIA